MAELRKINLTDVRNSDVVLALGASQSQPHAQIQPNASYFQVFRQKFHEYAQPVLAFRAKHLNLKVIPQVTKIVYGAAKFESFCGGLMFNPHLEGLKSLNGLVKYVKMCSTLDKQVEVDEPLDFEWRLLINPKAWQHGFKTLFICMKVFHDSRVFFSENALFKLGPKMSGIDVSIPSFRLFELATRADDFADEWFFIPTKILFKGPSVYTAYTAWSKLPADAPAEIIHTKRLNALKAGLSGTAEAIRFGFWAANKIDEYGPQISAAVPESIKAAVPYIKIAPTVLGALAAGIGLWQYYNSQSVPVPLQAQPFQEQPQEACPAAPQSILPPLPVQSLLPIQTLPVHFVLA